jgi:hypothetical protein
VSSLELISMRAPAAAVIVALGWVPACPAAAADLGYEGGLRGPMVADYYADAERAGALIIYDFEPGIVQRAYWLPPWRGRHYFPSHAEKVREVPAGRPKPPESYFRYWSNDGALLYPPPPADLGALDAAPAPRRHARSPAVKPLAKSQPAETDGIGGSLGD